MALSPQQQDELREQIFEKVARLAEANGGFFTYQELMDFEVSGIKIPLIGQRGITNPALFDSTLSVVSAADGPYNDHLGPDGMLRYAFENGNPTAGRNRKRLVSMTTRTPLILFERPMSNVYVPVIGAFVVDADLENRFVTIAIDNNIRRNYESGLDLVDELDRNYMRTEITRRVHQPIFRAKVISAYNSKCAICRLAHAELLDAAHIIPDRHEQGHAIVANGLALCKIHHAAYDVNLLGIDPDYKVHIDKELLAEIDGPMLEHGLKDMHLVELTVPSVSKFRPDRDRLAQRFEMFMS